MDNVNTNQDENQIESKNMMCNKCVYFHEHLMRNEKNKKTRFTFGEKFGLFFVALFCVFVVWLFFYTQSDSSDNWEIRITKTSNGIDVNYYDYDQMMEDVQKEYDDLLE